MGLGSSRTTSEVQVKPPSKQQTATLWPFTIIRYDRAEQVAARFMVYHDVSFVSDLKDYLGSSLSKLVNFPLLVQDTLKSDCIIFGENYQEVLYVLGSKLSFHRTREFDRIFVAQPAKPGQLHLPREIATNFARFIEHIKKQLKVKDASLQRSCPRSPVGSHISSEGSPVSPMVEGVPSERMEGVIDEDLSVINAPGGASS